MRRWLGIVCFACVCHFAFAANKLTVKKAYVDGKGWVHILTADGHDHIIRPKKWQAGGGFDDVAVAPDGRTVGWLAEQELTPPESGTNYSYAVALRLDVWRDGRVIRRFSPPALVIQDWMFLKGGSEVAFHVAPTHGIEYYDCTLFNVNTGKKMAHWILDRRDYVVPDWAKPLLTDDPLPGPGEISNWFPNTPVKKAVHPQQK